MKILHICLADPFTHKGGLNQYCKDLLLEQKRQGHDAKVMFPVGERKGHQVKIKSKGEDKFIVVNALPVAVNRGIDDPDRYMKKVDPNGYQRFLAQYEPDVIHVHSIQGIHLEFFQCTKGMGIPMVFTTHDYYPLCFRCVLYTRDNMLCTESTPHKCAVCNFHSGMSVKMQAVYQSYFYQEHKNNAFINKLKHQLVKRHDHGEEVQSEPVQVSEEIVRKFEALGQYYQKIFSYFDCIMGNSPMTMEIYKKAFPDANYVYLPITHAGIIPQTRPEFNKNTFNIAYMGGCRKDKGYFVFEKALDLLEENVSSLWEAWFYGEGHYPENQSSNSHRHYEGYFTADQAKTVWKNVDILVVPSQMPETFGFIVIEALARGIPVICSNLVGGKSIINKIDSQLIFDYRDAKDLSKKINYLLKTKNYLNVIQKIQNLSFDFDMTHHVEKIDDIYNKLSMHYSLI
jgi:glycosyltransferase involved in cell wall biosynthesis